MKAISTIIKLLNKDQKSKLILILFFVFCAMLLEAMSIALIIPIISVVFEKAIPGEFSVIQDFIYLIKFDNENMFIYFIMILMIIVFLLKNIFLFLISFAQSDFIFKIQREFASNLFKSYMVSDYEFHFENNTSQLIRNITTEVAAFSNIIGSIIFLIADICIAIAIGFILLYLNWLSSLVIILFMGIFGFSFFFIWKKTNTRWGEERQVYDGKKIQYIQQGLGGIKEIKLLGHESYIINLFKKITYLVSIISRNQQVIQFIPKVSLETVAVTALGLVVITLVFYNFDRNNLIYYIGIYALAGYRMMPLVVRLISSAQIIQFYLPVVKVIDNELNREKNINTDTNEIKNLNKRSNEFIFNKSIDLKNISLTYKSSHNASVSGVTLSIAHGTTTGIMGESGAGKSTLVDIILGLIKPSEGEVLVNGKNINSNVKGWQSLIGYVPQDIYLNDDTLRNNIALGVSPSEINNENIINSIRSAHIEDYINSLKDGLDTFVGERGVRLSGGQLQRIGIARALYHKPSLIIFDEATSSLDIETEKDVMKSIYEMNGEKTIIIISHRKSTLDQCNQIYYLRKGKLVK